MPDLVSISSGSIAILVIIVVIVLLFAYISRRYQVAGPNEAFIIAGAKGSKIRQPDGQLTEAQDEGLRVVVGAGVIILPIIHKKKELSLRSRQAEVQLADGVTAQGIKVRVNGNAVFKVGREREQIRKAAERFVDQDSEIDKMVTQVLQGSLRSIVGQLTIESLVTNRTELMTQVTAQAKQELEPLGIELDVFNIQDIADTGFDGQESYIAQLGKKNYQAARRDAEIATAAAQKEIIAAQRDQALRQAEADSQTQAAAAKAAQAGPLAQAEAAQEVTRRQTELAALEAARREQELVASTVKQAAAEASAAIARAQGQRQATIAEAEAEAAKVRLEGEAAAAAIFARGRAEAEAMALKAEAYRAYNQAAVLSTILERLPEMIREAAAPMAQIDSLTVLSSDGASEVVRNATRTVAEAQTVIKGLTGIDITTLIGGALSGATGADASARSVGDMAASMAGSYTPTAPAASVSEAASDSAAEAATQASATPPEVGARGASAAPAPAAVAPAAPPAAPRPAAPRAAAPRPAGPPAAPRAGTARPAAPPTEADEVRRLFAALPADTQDRVRRGIAAVPAALDDRALGSLPALGDRLPLRLASLTIGQARDLIG